MRDINSVILLGRLTREPEYKTVADKTVANFALANNNGRDTNGTDFFDVEYWGKGAEAIREYLHKGSQIIVSGRLRQSKWEKDGKTQSKILINAETVQLVGGKSQEKHEETPADDGDNIPF